jgi:Domain of unknown function (DUF6285)
VKVEPSAAELLEIARATILSEIAPALPEGQRYAALMAANALAIAGRDLAATDASAAELARVSALLPGPGGGTAALREATAHLAKAIREGRFDEGEARASLLAHLRRTVRERLAVSNPRALDRDERTPT